MSTERCGPCLRRRKAMASVAKWSLSANYAVQGTTIRIRIWAHVVREPCPPPHHRRTKHICIRTYVRTYVRTHIYVRTYVPLSTYMYICTYVCVYVLNHASLSTDNWIRTCAWGNKTCDGRRDRRNIWDRHFKFGTYGSPFLFFFGWSRILADSALWISERSAGRAPVHTRTYAIGRLIRSCGMFLARSCKHCAQNNAW